MAKKMTKKMERIAKQASKRARQWANLPPLKKQRGPKPK